MVNFYGEFRVTLDAKNRIMIPSRFRDEASGKRHWILTRGLDHCLALYLPERWEELAKKINEIPFTKKKARDFQRLLFSKAVTVETDAQGRILIPEYLKTLGRLDKKTVFVGLADRIELWSEEIWQKLQDQTTDDFENLAEDLFS